MDRPASRPGLSTYLSAGSLVFGMIFAAAGNAQGQTAGQGGSTASQSKAAGADRRGGSSTTGAARKADQPRKEPSQAFRESIRRTVEKRRQRRANRGQGMGDSIPIGAIVTWPMPPALIIRHMPQVHDEIESLLGVLRK